MKRRHRQHDEEDEDLLSIDFQVKVLVWGCAAIVTAVVTYLKLRDVDVVSVVNNVTATIILRTTVLLYFACWVAGVERDREVQRAVLAVWPMRRSAIVVLYLTGMLLTGAFLLMVSAEHLPLIAAHLPPHIALLGGLSLLWLLNGSLWALAVKVVWRQPFRLSHELYRQQKRYVQMERLKAVEHHAVGAWQWWRFSIGVSVLAAVSLVALFRGVAEHLGAALGGVTPDVVIALGILSFVLITEAWMWFKRLEVMIALRSFRRLARSYYFTPK